MDRTKSLPVGSVQTTRSFRPSVLKTKSSTTIKSMTFTSPLVRRGSKVSSILKGFGAVLQNSAGSAETYAMSEPVEGLHVFISHNWSTRRRNKFMALALHFNLRLALVVAAVASLAVGPLVVFRILPVIQAADTSSYPMSSPYCTTLCYILPMAMLLWGRDLLAKIGCVCEPYVFMDKTCIHQTDVNLQREGIQCLSAFLSVSDEMLVVYTNLYLSKLWTVYELASMLMIKDEPRITIASTHLVSLLYVCWTSSWIHNLLVVMVGSKASQDLVGEDLRSFFGLIVNYGIVVPCIAPTIWYLRRWALERKSMHDAAKAFRIRSTLCAVEGDRQVVQTNVAFFMRDFGFVTPNATPDEALDKFDEIAQKRVALHLDASFGPVGVPYWHAMVTVLPLAGRALDIVWANLNLNFHPRFYIAEANFYLGEAFFIVPIWVSLCFFSTSRFPKMSWAREVALLVVLTIFLFVTLAGLDKAYSILYNYALDSWLAVAVMLGVTGVLGVMVGCLYRPLPAPPVSHECQSLMVQEEIAMIKHTTI